MTSTGYEIAQALVKHKIDPVRASALLADREQKLALIAYLESLTVPPPPPVQEFYANGRPRPSKPPKPDKTREVALRCLAAQAAAPSPATGIIKGTVLKATIVGPPAITKVMKG